MPRHIVFLGAPSLGAVRTSTKPQLDLPEHYKWTNVVIDNPAVTAVDDHTMDVYRLPPATLEEASRRISRLYENIIFQEDVEEHEEEEGEILVADQSVDEYARGMFFYERCLPYSRPSHNEILLFR